MSKQNRWMLAGIAAVVALGAALAWQYFHPHEMSPSGGAVATKGPVNPDEPGGTPKNGGDQSGNESAVRGSERPKTYAVLDFQISTRSRAALATPGSRRENGFSGNLILVALGVETSALGSEIADAFATNLKESGATNVIRKHVVFSDADLKDVSRTRALREELQADVIVGGRLDESAELLTVTSVRADNAKVVGKVTQPAPTQELKVYVASVKEPAYLRVAGSKEEVGIQLFQQLHAGDQVRCGTDGDLVILINDKVFHIKPSDGWFTVKASVRPKFLNGALPAIARTLFEESQAQYIVAASR